jgi:HlyD family secretion protein
MGGMPPKSFKKRADGKKASGNLVWVSIDGKAAPRPVKTGISDGVNIQILKGLSVGDSVVVSQETLGSAKEKSAASSPFMPSPPGKKKK